MLLVTHIIIALTSVIFSSYTYFFPSKLKLNFNYLLVVLTIVTGTMMIFAYPAHMVKSCFVGCLYVGGMVFLISAVRKKLAKVESV